MSWDEFITLLSGLNGKTPLGRVVAIRAEDDPETLKHFTTEQKRIRSEWRKQSSKNVAKETYEDAMRNFENMFKAMASQ